MTLYTIDFKLLVGTDASQSVVTSSIESAVMIFKRKYPGVTIRRVSVGDRVLMYEEANEVTES